MPPPKKCPDPGAPAWMLTFGDMNTLLLTFFVFLITTMTVDIKKFNLVLSAFQGAIGVMEQGKSINLTREELMNMGQKTERLGQQKQIVRPTQEVQQILGWISKNFKKKEVQVQITERGFKILLTDEAIFERGSDRLTPDARNLVGRIAYFLNTVVPRDNLRVEGHTDDVPIEGARGFRSNLVLSAARAARVYEALENFGVRPERMSIAGYGAMRPVKRREGESIEAWRARNRRVEIVVLWRQGESG
ncbi:MAG: flagellar motor protein MotB [Candidatus Hydrogenedentota bacterium]|nr:MAG: flagellar motor protein MotB [Candidatus Hydrogenedentota bacterium]